jgi:hypothetical protein
LVFAVYLNILLFPIGTSDRVKLVGKEVPAYFDRLTIKGDGLLERAFK